MESTFPTGLPGSAGLAERAAPLIRLEGITRIFRVGETEVCPLRDVTLAFDRGEFAAIRGASGSGKTTLMTILGCLDRPSRGRYVLDGQDVSLLKSDRLAYLRNRMFGFVFQNFNLLARTSALENVELPLLYWNRESGRQRRERAMAALAAVGLADRAGHSPGRLSGGEQQRVAIARAVVNHPSVLLADEPTGNLDSRSEREILELFRTLHAGGTTVILITHNPEVASAAQRTIRIRDGMIQEGPP